MVLLPVKRSFSQACCHSQVPGCEGGGSGSDTFWVSPFSGRKLTNHAKKENQRTYTASSQSPFARPTIPWNPMNPRNPRNPSIQFLRLTRPPLTPEAPLLLRLLEPDLDGLRRRITD